MNNRSIIACILYIVILLGLSLAISYCIYAKLWITMCLCILAQLVFIFCIIKNQNKKLEIIYSLISSIRYNDYSVSLGGKKFHLGKEKYLTNFCRH